MRFPYTWYKLSFLYEESTLPDKHDRVIKALLRYLESTKDDESKYQAWLMLANTYAQKNDFEGEMHARIELAQLPDIPFSIISDTANRFNQLFNQQKLNLDTDVKRIMVEKLLSVMEKRMGEGNVIDCSRIAWLFMHANNQSKAKDFTLMGLHKDPDDDYIRSVAFRLKII
jgi:hypothetical protein